MPQHQHTTALVREIIAHYWCYSGAFRGDEKKWSPAVQQCVEALIRKGMLAKDAEGVIYAASAPCEMYMDALAAVPLPVRSQPEWSMPS